MQAGFSILWGESGGHSHSSTCGPPQDSWPGRTHLLQQGHMQGGPHLDWYPAAGVGTTTSCPPCTADLVHKRSRFPQGPQSHTEDTQWPRARLGGTNGPRPRLKALRGQPHAGTRLGPRQEAAWYRPQASLGGPQIRRAGGHQLSGGIAGETWTGSMVREGTGTEGLGTRG